MGTRDLSISDELLLKFFHEGEHPAYKIVEDAIPPDAKVISIWHNNGMLTLRLISGAWDDKGRNLLPVAIINPLMVDDGRVLGIVGTFHE